jgi:hypothetical protein
MLLIVAYPGPSETREAAARGDQRAQEEVGFLDARERFLAEFDRRKLRSPDQLPDLGGERLEFSWDMPSEDEKLAVIRLGEQEVWTEPALWEGYERFNEVKALLKERYGSRFRSLTPTERGKTWLYGDDPRIGVTVD